MDRLGGTYGSFDGSDDHDLDLAADVVSAEPPPSPVGQDERRMQVRAYNHWSGLLGSSNFPVIEDLNPEELDDFGPFSVLLDFQSGIDDPAIRYLGDQLATECDADQEMSVLSDVPSLSLLSRITDHYMQILANQAPIGFEAEFVNQRDLTVLYRGILLPFSSDGKTIDFIYGVINWKEVADQELTDQLLVQIGDALNADQAEEEEETEDFLELGDELRIDQDAELAGTDVLELGAELEENSGILASGVVAAAPIGAGLKDEAEDVLDLAALGEEAVDPVELPVPAFGNAEADGHAETDQAEDADEYAPDYSPDYGLGDLEDEPETDDVDDLVDPLGDENISTGLTSLVSRGDKPKKQFVLPSALVAEADEAVEPTQEAEPFGLEESSQEASSLEEWAAREESEQAPAPINDFKPADELELTHEVTLEDLEAEQEPTDIGLGADFSTDAQPIISPEATPAEAPEDAFAGDPLAAVQVPAATDDSFDLDDDASYDAAAVDDEAEAEEGLYDCLASAREAAQLASASEDRSRAALYDAVGRAYDFSLAAYDNPEDFAELIAENGLTVQTRAPMTPIVKLVFGADYDKTRLTEYAAVLMHAKRQMLARGTLSEFLRTADGGLKGVVQAERQARRVDEGKPAKPAKTVRKTLAKKLRKLDANTWDDISKDGAEFALVMVRREADGAVTPIGEVPEDIALVEKAARKLLA